MMPETFLAQFGHIADAPNGVQKLRALILDLAVRGKLVEQDPNDEPASELLKRIKVEKENHAKAQRRGGRKYKSEPITEDEIPFALPEGWEWSRFGAVYSLEYGDNLPAVKRSNTGEYPVYGSNGIVGSHFESFVDSPCIVVGRKGSAGALNLSLSDGCCVTDVAYYCVPPRELDIIFSFKLFHTLGLDIMGKGIKPGLNRNEVYGLLLPVPPFAEQKRIVAKVDQLMRLCDRLEAQQKRRVEIQGKATASSLNALVNSADAEAFAANWRRIATRFDHLIDSRKTLKALRATILDLAVRGKLVPQDPNDEPASELLKRIKVEKENHAKAQRRRGRKDKSASLSEDELPFELPDGWEWSRFGEVYLLEYGDNLPAIKRSNTGEYPVYGSNGIVGSHFKSFVNSPCIVVGRKGSAGALNLSLSDGCCVTDVAYYCIPPRELDIIFSFKLFHTLGLDILGKGIKPGLNRNEVYELLIPLPPLAEQKRIVARVDQLMAVCNRLDAQLQVRESTGEKLATSFTHHLLAAA